MMKQPERKPKKHAELIKAWADGAEIETLDLYGFWIPIDTYPSWGDNDKYRIKSITVSPGTALMRSYQAALKNCSSGSDDLWQVAAEIFMQEIEDGKVKGF